jgi:DNA helicase-2/ATP-dependent DNA helicase PcrA
MQAVKKSTLNNARSIASSSEIPSTEIQREENPTTLSDKALKLIETEQSVLSSVHADLVRQKSHGQHRFSIEKDRARDLTADLVAASRAEDKAMLASDEAVSHALKDMKQDELGLLARLLKKPYFARIVLNERGRTIEYKLGHAANPDCRIIDWRKAPISKLYYEYREGDDYSEEIQGQDREGKIALRHTVDIDRSELKRLSCKLGEFEKRAGSWHQLKAGSEGSSQRQAGGLKEILALITPEQFRLITEHQENAVLIQGIAGSGKTTVALHRLAYLLHQEALFLNSANCAVIVFNRALKAYVEHTLPSIDVSGVKVFTLSDWLYESAKKIVVGIKFRANTTSSIERLKRSSAYLYALEQLAKTRLKTRSLTAPDYLTMMVETLSYPDQILKHDDSKLLDSSIIKATQEQLAASKLSLELDRFDCAAIIRLSQLMEGLKPIALAENLEHVVLDEIQELSALEIASVLGSAKSLSQVTLVGDTAQETSYHRAFPGWNALRRHWGLDDESSRFITLALSHRSTLPIMKLADHVSGQARTESGREGRVPLWINTSTEEKAVEQTIGWIGRVRERYPATVTAIICATRDEARMLYGMLTPSFGASVRYG